MRYFYLLVLFISNITLAQTELSGGIYSDKILKKSESPYLVNSKLVVFPGITVTVEPGVEIRFKNEVGLEIRGNFFALGTSQNRIKFTGMNKTIGSWAGITFLEVDNSNSGFDFCDFEYATYNYLMSNYTGSLYFKNSKFYKNLRAIAMFTSFEVPIDNCIFDSNEYAITSINKKITNCTFTNNQFAIAQGGNLSIFNSNFSNNIVAIDADAITVDNTTIINNGTGLELSTSDVNSITNCTISNNNTGIALYTSALNNALIKSNKICNNLNYNVRIFGSNNVSLKENCWCTEDKSIIDGLIYDGYDNVSLGLVSYDIYDADCTTKLGAQNLNVKEKIEIYPNPFTSHLNIKIGKSAKKIVLNIFSLDGKKVETENFENTNQINYSPKNLNAGSYILNIDIDGEVFNRKILKK